MNTELTDRQKNILGQALFRQLSLSDDAGKEEVSNLGVQLGVLGQMASYAHTVVAALEARQIQENKRKDDDPDGYKMDRYV